MLGLLCCGFGIVSLAQADFSGTVVGVLDGDTIEVLHDGVAERIRLQGIDCPEKRQAFGQKAKQATSDLAFGKQVSIVTHGLDKYGRTIGDVIIPDGKKLNYELVRQGWCWWYRKYDPDNAELARLEADARKARIGLWTDPSPIPPWEWRRHCSEWNTLRQCRKVAWKSILSVWRVFPKEPTGEEHQNCLFAPRIELE
jgi:endonuclease YncB( thermonuclease family)